MSLNDHPHYPIVVGTCEDRNLDDPRPIALVPNDGERASLFRIQGTSELRKAIVPIFQADSADIVTGMGTAFSLDPWGSFLSADHVTDFVRQGIAGQPGEFTIRPDVSALALLGMGLIFDEIGIRREALVPIAEFRTPVVEVEDPLNCSARPSMRPYDITFLNTATTPPNDMIRNLPLRRHPSSPSVGDLVVAIGYPEIKLARGATSELPTSITEGMFAAYGVIRKLYPSGRDRSAPTPVFEIYANWPSGMSGGPVFNAVGEVIGIVSRSVAPVDCEQMGIAWATWLAASIPLTAATSWPDSVDPADPYFRRAWGAVQLDPWAIEGFPSTQPEAAALATALGGGFAARMVSHRLGTTTYCVSS